MQIPSEFTRYQQYSKKPTKFFKEVLNAELFSWQKNVLKDIEDNFCKKNGSNVVFGNAIAGGNGTGKSFFGMQLMIWHFCSHPMSRNIMMTNSERQTKRTGYAVLQEKLSSLFPEKSISTSEKRSCFKTKEIDTEGMWDMMYFTQTRVESGMTGLHDDNMFFFYDECIDFPEHSWKALDNMCTKGRVLIYCSANPIKTGTPFHDLFLYPPDNWKCYSVSSFDVPEKYINRDFIEMKRLKYGVNSSDYRCSVLGQFPDVMEDSPFPVTAIIGAMKRENKIFSHMPSVLGVDVAEGVEYGSACAVALRKGNQFTYIQDFKCNFEEFRILLYDLIAKYEPTLISIDANGVGYALASEFRRRFGDRIFPVKLQQSAFDHLRFNNKKTELMYRFSHWIRDPSVVLPFDEDLIRILPKIKFCDSKEMLSMEDQKKAFKKEYQVATGVMDKIDAMMLTFIDETIDKMKNSAIRNQIRQFNNSGNYYANSYFK